MIMAIGALGVYLFLFLGLYFEVFLLITFFEKKPAGKTFRKPTRYPSVSIIVPCWNEEKTIARTLKSLLELEYPKSKLSIIVVDDGSQDMTFQIAKRFEKRDSRVRVFSKENGGKYTALNFGIAQCDSELVGCLDADSFVTTDALIETVKKFEENSKTMAIVPAMKVHEPRRPLELMQAVEYTFGVFCKKMFGNLAAISVLPGPFSIYKREVFTKIGFFRHAHQTEDMEMAFRMHAHGMTIDNAHTAIVYTKVPQTVRALLRQRRRWSRGFLENSRDYRHMFFNSQFGNFGFLTLPVGLSLFFGALYMFCYVLFRTGAYAVTRITDIYATQIPLYFSFSTEHWTWFYINTSMLTFLSLMTVTITLISVLIGRRIAGANFGVGSLVSYFMLYMLLAPLWLGWALWGAVRVRESSWR